MIPEPRKPRSRRTDPAPAASAKAATAPAVAGANAGEWTVSELAGALKRTLEDAFGHVRLRGEIFGYRGPHSSGHAYFCLKDRDARIDAVVWKGTFGRLAIKPEEGLEVIATGRITTFPGKSAYQIVVEHLEPAGAGALMALLEERRRRLAAEGLFADGRKRPLPFLPRVVGVVTSPTGAVIRDILNRVADRFPRTVLVWPVRVQGETCAAEVAAAIAGFNALPASIPRPDVLIVARGGGSIEDLWGFNDEAVVRAVVASAIPVIAAVGHETDWTLIDHAADRRAPTPTGAAEMAVPVRAELAGAVAALAARRLEAAGRLLEGRRAELRSAARALPAPDALLGPPRQRVDLLAARLPPALLANARLHERQLRALADGLARHAPRTELGKARARVDAVGRRPIEALRRNLDGSRAALGAVADRFAAARTRQVAGERQALAARRERVAELGEGAARAIRTLVGRRRDALAARADLLASLGYLSVLQRGYALVRDGEDRPVMRAGAVAPGASLVLEFADGRRRVQAEGARARRRGEALVQTSLFDM